MLCFTFHVIRLYTVILYYQYHLVFPPLLGRLIVVVIIPSSCRATETQLLLRNRSECNMLRLLPSLRSNPHYYRPER